MFFFETKFYFSLGRKKFARCKELLDIYYAEKGETYAFNKYSFNYYYEINDYSKAFKYFKQCIVLKGIDKKFEDWGIQFFVRKNITEGKYQLAAKNAIAIASLENLNDDNRALLIKLLKYIKEHI